MCRTLQRSHSDVREPSPPTPGLGERSARLQYKWGESERKAQNTAYVKSDEKLKHHQLAYLISRNLFSKVKILKSKACFSRILNLISQPCVCTPHRTLAHVLCIK